MLEDCEVQVVRSPPLLQGFLPRVGLVRHRRVARCRNMSGPCTSTHTLTDDNDGDDGDDVDERKERGVAEERGIRCLCDSNF